MQIWWTDGDVVRKLRNIAGMRLKDLADRSGVSMQVIHRIESGKTKEPTRTTITRIAEAFGLTYRDFIDLIPSPSRELPEEFAAGQGTEVTLQPDAAAKERRPQQHKGKRGRPR